MIKINGGWVGINTNNPNKIAFEAVRDNRIPELSGYDTVKREVKFGDSRFDVMAQKEGETCFIEVKNVTMKEGSDALFPDAVTTRGRKHLNTLMEVKKQGMRAVMLYIIQRVDVDRFGPADDIDPEYGKALREAYRQGVEIIPMQAEVTPEGIELVRKLDFEL
jgi:sugar fermentation stimulation protein A